MRHRTFVGAVALALLGLVVPPSSAGEPPAVPALKDVSPWPVGVAVSEPQLTGARGELVTRTFSQITPENAMKPAYIWRDPAVTDWRRWDWAAADAYVDFAREHGLRVHAHTLIWHQQMPQWFYERRDGTPYWDATTRSCLAPTTADRDLMRERIRTYVDGFAQHFRTTYGEYGTAGNPIVAVDVVNEAVENTDDHLRHDENPLACVLGAEYVEVALRAAGAAFGDATGARAVKLFLNDFNTEWSWKSDDQLAVVRDLVGRGVPLDGVGHQLHLSLRDRDALLEPQNLPRTLAQIDDLGLLQAVTELDVAIADPPVPDDLLPGLLAQQGELYHDLFALFRDHNLFSVSVWGLDDDQTWRAGTRPLLFDADLQPKPALRGALEQRPVITADLPAARTVADGQPVTLSLGQVGHPSPLITWQRRRATSDAWTTLASGAASRLTVTATLPDDGARLRAVLVNSHGTTTSAETLLTVTRRPVATSVVASPATGVYGRPLVVPVTVPGATGGVVRATVGDWTGTAAVTTSGTATVRVPARRTPPGRAVLDLRFTGTTTAAPSARAVAVVIERAPATITLRHARSARAGGRLAVEVRVRVVGAPVTGPATVRIAGRSGRVRLDATGRGRVVVRLPARAGRAVVRAGYGGSALTAAATATTSVLVRPR